jgi:diguanylate cyclase (GGDEF)-like protein
MAWPTALIVLVIASATTATVAVAHRRIDEVHSSAEVSFAAAAERMSTALRIQLQRTTDIADNAGTYIKVTHGLTQGQFQTWFDGGGLDVRSGLLGLGYIERVPTAALASYRAELAHDQGASSAPAFTVEPAGRRPVYCFVRIEDSGAAAAIGKLPAGFDICATGAAKELLRSAASTGQAAIMSIAPAKAQPKTDQYLAEGLRAISGTAFAIFEPLYDGASADESERRASIKGWVVGAFDGPTMVRTALGRDYDSVALTLSWGARPERVIAESSDEIQSDARHSSLAYSASLGGQWRLRLSAPDNAVVRSARWSAATTAGRGGLLTMLLAALMLVMSRSRSRALRLVETKTEELRHQAMHDPLTGLPNRVLVLDRATQLLVRARRNRTSAAALFLDLDGFKAVNDRFGHHAGDALLRGVAARLKSSLRESETISRLGGDEFVVLADGAATDVLAERILAVMAEPFDLGETTRAPVNVGVSIGIATGDQIDANELLRRADVAMYRAKASGRGTYVTFAPEMSPMSHPPAIDLHPAA